MFKGGLDMSSISQRLYDSIKRKGYSYGELAKLTGIPKSAIQRYATGETPKIPMDRLQLMAEALGVSAQYLMGWDEEEPKEDLVNGDPELTEILQRAKDDPNIRMLFSVTKNATPEDIEMAIKIIQRFKGE